jgi:hypothetical protein
VPWAIGALVACASNPSRSAVDPTQQAGVSASVQNRNAPVREFLAQKDGLELRLWTLLSGQTDLAATLGQHGAVAAIEEPDRSRLRMNGLRLVRVPHTALEPLLASLGEAVVDLSAWHGQAHDWRDARSATIQNGVAAAIDGRVQPLSGDALELLVRAWTLPMEDGPCIHVESKSRLVEEVSVDYQQLLTRQRADERSTYFSSMSFDLALAPECAYLLIGEAAAASWTVSGYDDSSVTTVPHSGAVHAGVATRGPLSDVGPDALVPPTVGELLFPAGSGAATRDVLVLVPHVSEQFLPVRVARREAP